MRPPLTATVPGQGPVGEQHRGVLASMPDRLRAVDAGGDVALVAGSVEGWTTTVAEIVRGGARGVLVVDAGVDDGPDEIRAADRAAREAKAVVLVDRPHAMNRAWQRVVPQWRRDAAEAVLLDSTTAVEDHSLMRALLEQLALIRSVLDPLEQLTVVHRSRSIYQLAGHAGSVRLSLSGTQGPCAALTLDLVGAVRRRQARFAPIGLAAPARISAFDRRHADRTALVRERPPRSMETAARRRDRTGRTPRRRRPRPFGRGRRAGGHPVRPPRARVIRPRRTVVVSELR